MSEPSGYSDYIQYLQTHPNSDRHLLTPEEEAQIQRERLQKHRELEQLTVYPCSGVQAAYIFTLDAEGGIHSVPHCLFRWEDECLTLKQIAQQMRHRWCTFGVFYVWVETPLKGKIYCYGNEGEYWTEYGTTQGYA